MSALLSTRSRPIKRGESQLYRGEIDARCREVHLPFVDGTIDAHPFTSTSYIVGRIESGLSPRLMVRLPWGSMSTTRTR